MVASLLPIAVQPTPTKEVSAKATAGGPSASENFSAALAAATERNLAPSAATKPPIASPKQGKNLSLATENEAVPSVRDKVPNKDSAQHANPPSLDGPQQNVPPAVPTPCAMEAFQTATVAVPAQGAEPNGSAPLVTSGSGTEAQSVPSTAAVAAALVPVSSSPSQQLGVGIAVEPTLVAPAAEVAGTQRVSGVKDAVGDALKPQTENALPESDSQPQSLPTQAIQAPEIPKVPPLSKGAVAPISSKLGLGQDAKVSKLASNADSKAGTIDQGGSSPIDKPGVSSIRPATDNNLLSSIAAKGGSARQIAEPAERQSEQSTNGTPIAPAPVSDIDALSALSAMPTQTATKGTGAAAAVKGGSLSSPLGKSPLPPPGNSPSGTASTKMQSSKTGFTASLSESANETDDIGAASQATPSGELITAQVADSSASGKHENSTGFPKNDRHLPDSGSPSAQVSAEMDKHIEAPPVYPSLLQSARLVQHLGEAELRVGIHSGEFGNVDIRTSMAHNQFTAQISVERNELGRVLAAELPSLQNRLSEHRLASANIILQNQSADSGCAGFQQGSRQGENLPRVVIPQAAEAVSIPLQSAIPEGSVPSARLDVHM